MLVVGGFLLMIIILRPGSPLRGFALTSRVSRTALASSWWCSWEKAVLRYHVSSCGSLPEGLLGFVVSADLPQHFCKLFQRAGIASSSSAAENVFGFVLPASTPQ